MKKIKLLSLVLLMMSFSVFVFNGCSKDNGAIINSNNKLAMIIEEKDGLELELFFDASKDENNISVESEKRFLIPDELVGEVILLELIKGPSVESTLKPIFPKETNLISFCISEGIAYVNLSGEAQYPMTKAKEEVILTSISKSLINLESVDSVKLLIANNNIETLGGNFDLSKAFTPETLVLIEKSE